MDKFHTQLKLHNLNKPILHCYTTTEIQSALATGTY